MPDPLTASDVERLRDLHSLCSLTARQNAVPLDSKDEMAGYADALARAVAVLERLPVTADGVVIPPGHIRLWVHDIDGKPYEVSPGGPFYFNQDPKGDFERCNKYYSTESAARAAAEGRDLP